MITDELILYIEKKLNQNISKENIKDNLIEVGWRSSDIEEGFLKVNQKINQLSSQKVVKYNIDPYREKPTEGESILSPEEKIIEKKELTPIKKEEAISPETGISDKKDIGKIWIPKAIKPVEDKDNLSLEKGLEIRPEELTGENNKSQENITPKEPLSFYKENITQTKVVNKDSVKPIMEDIKPEKNNEENIPKLIPKTPKPSFSTTESISTRKEPNINSNSSFYGGSLSKSAMISSYANDLMMANSVNQKKQKPRKNKFVRFFMTIIVVLLIMAIIVLILSLSKEFLNINFL